MEMCLRGHEHLVIGIYTRGAEHYLNQMNEVCLHVTAVWSKEVLTEHTLSEVRYSYNQNTLNSSNRGRHFHCLNNSRPVGRTMGNCIAHLLQTTTEHCTNVRICGQSLCNVINYKNKRANYSVRCKKWRSVPLKQLQSGKHTNALFAVGPRGGAVG